MDPIIVALAKAAGLDKALAEVRVLIERLTAERAKA